MTKKVFTLIIAMMLVIVTLEISLSTSSSVTTYEQQQKNQVDDTNSSNNKVVILTFGDTYKSQFSIAKPILDKYGFKASFFITCSYADDQKKMRHLSWDDIVALQEDGHDIESKGMTPIDLNKIVFKRSGF